MKNIKIKISSIKHLTDARYFSSKEVEYLGFNRFLTSSKDVQLIQEWVYGPQIVSEFVGNTCEIDIQKKLSEFATDVLHFDFFTDLDTIQNFTDFELFQDIDLDSMELDKLIRKMNATNGIIDYFVLQSTKSFQLRKEDLKTLGKLFPCFIDLKFELDDLSSLAAMNMEGLVLRGGEEERVGIKSFDELDEIFDWIENSNKSY